MYLKGLSMPGNGLCLLFKNKGGTNKDLAKFIDQINALCDKWIDNIFLHM